MNAIWKTRLSTGWPRLLLVVVSLAGLGYGLRWERHKVAPLDDASPQYISGLQFVDGTTFDKYGRWSGEVYDLKSLSPLAASERDCKT